MVSPKGKEKILIVDDQPENVWPLTQHLQSSFDVLCSTSGADALEIVFSANKPDLILLDIMMPDMDGYEVCEKLKADDASRDIPVIFLTGKTTEPEQVKGLGMGAHDYITKPFSIPVVTARIQSVLNVKKEMDRRLLLRAQLEVLNRQLEYQVKQKMLELETANKALRQYEEKWQILFKQKSRRDKSPRILVVDDNPDNIHILIHNLQSKYEVMCTTSGQETLDIAFSENRPDLILLDIMMPEMDGYEVCARLKANASTWDIPVIFVTALDQEPDETKGLNLGAVDFVTKPFSIPVVNARITAALRLKEEMDHRADLARKLEELNENLEVRIQEKAVELEQAHEDVIASERKYRSIYENATEGIFQTTPEGLLLDASPSLARILGYQSSYELTATVTDVASQLYYRPEDRDEVFEILNRKGEIVDFETQFKKKNGQVIWVMFSAKTVHGAEGNPGYYQGFVIDITERKKTEKELQRYRDRLEELVDARTAELAEAKEQADAANAAKSDFLARMSHEIRTPLNAVTGLTNILLKSEMTAEQRDYLNKVQLAGDNLLGVINDILDFSKVEAGQLELTSAPFDLEQILERLADLFSNRVAEKDIELVFTMAPQVPRQLKGDGGRLTQVLTNLIENAVKFTGSGEIIVRVDVDKQDELQSGLTPIQFRVSDTGTGIEDEVLPTLFEPFTQADSSLTRKHEGTGLGLAICHRLVELMGGRIWAESTPGRGSTFYFTVNLMVHSEDGPRFYPPPDLQGLKVLVVDDSATARQTLCDMLDSLTFRVSSVESGEQAVEILEQAASKEPYQLVLLDWKMPGMDGLETARRIRQLRNRAEEAAGYKRKAPIIIMVTAYGYELVQERIDAATVDSVLLKPLKPSELFNAIMELFDKTEGQVKRINFKDAEAGALLAGRRLLVVEDSALNREVAVALLEQSGLTVETAENGETAVTMVERSSQGYYDAIFMDIQMPFMDGYEATEKIRILEKQRRAKSGQVQSGDKKGGQRVPIIALTAHALKGEEEKCLQAGMDDYLAKPIDEDMLNRILGKWILPELSKWDDRGPTPESGKIRAEIVLDTKKALDRLGGRRDIYLRALRSFLSECGDAGIRIENQLMEGERDEALRLSHTVKSSAAVIGGEDLRQIAAELEETLSTNGSDPDELSLDFKEKLEGTLEAVERLLKAENDTAA